MKPLEKTQRMLNFLYLSPSNSGKWSYDTAYAIFLFIIDWCIMAAIGTFMLQNIITIYLENVFYALFQLSAFIGVTYMVIVTNVLRKEMNGFLNTLERICEESKSFFVLFW